MVTKVGVDWTNLSKLRRISLVVLKGRLLEGLLRLREVAEGSWHGDLGRLVAGQPNTGE